MNRISHSIAINWRFDYYPEFDEAVTAPEYEDSGWRCISLPHTWNTWETTGEEHPFIYAAAESDDKYWWYGYGVYRKRFTVSSTLCGLPAFLEFDGVQKHCRIWLNGNFAGEHLGGYSSFSIDITGKLLDTGDNVLVVAVSNKRNDPEKIPPMSAGNFNVYGGIYRDVRLVVKQPVYIPFQGNADHEGGTRITTPDIADGKGIVCIDTYLKNALSQPRTQR